MPTIHVHFVLTGEFDPNKVTSTLHVQPTKTWKKGEHIQNTMRVYEHDGWRLSSGEVESLDVSQQVLEILDRLRP